MIKPSGLQEINSHRPQLSGHHLRRKPDLLKMIDGVDRVPHGIPHLDRTLVSGKHVREGDNSRGKLPQRGRQGGRKRLVIGEPGPRTPQQHPTVPQREIDGHGSVGIPTNPAPLPPVQWRDGGDLPGGGQRGLEIVTGLLSPRATQRPLGNRTIPLGNGVSSGVERGSELPKEVTHPPVQHVPRIPRQKRDGGQPQNPTDKSVNHAINPSGPTRRQKRGDEDGGGPSLKGDQRSATQQDGDRHSKPEDEGKLPPPGANLRDQKVPNPDPHTHPNDKLNHPPQPRLPKPTPIQITTAIGAKNGRLCPST